MSLSSIWLSATAMDFRRKIHRGRFPSKDCHSCYRNGTQSSLRSSFSSVISLNWARYAAACTAAGTSPQPVLCGLISKFSDHVQRNRPSDIPTRLFKKLLKALRLCETDDLSARARCSLANLALIVQASQDFAAGRTKPGVVATFRQVNLVSVCNLGCLHCLGNVNDEIERGTKVNGTRHKRMSPETCSSAMENMGDITSFFMNGSEFFLHKGWKDLVKMFSQKGIFLLVSTNGMLLTPAVTNYLVETGVLGSLNISFDGAKQETIEKIRRGVDYRLLIEHTKYFLAHLDQTGTRIPVSLSMVLMRSNFQEAEDLVKLAVRLRGESAVEIHLSFQVLDHSESPRYRRFRALQNVDILDPLVYPNLLAADHSAGEAGIKIFYSSAGPLKKALEVVESNGLSKPTPRPTCHSSGLNRIIMKARASSRSS